MVDRAIIPEKSEPQEEEVFELDKDDRWQARLAEARARREIALREKGKSPKKPRKKPWEEEAGDDSDQFTVEPVIQDPVDDRLDFADRFEAIKDGGTPSVEPVPETKAEEPPHRPPFASFDDIIPREVEPEPTNVMQIMPQPALKAELAKRDEPSLINDGAPDVIDLAQRYAATLSPPVDAAIETVVEDESPETPEAPAQPEVAERTGKPGLLLLLIAGLAALPLAKPLPPLEVGPSAAGSPFFGLVPALGITASMVWTPGETASGEWLPVTTVPPPQPLGAPRPAVASFQSEIIPPVQAVGEGGFGSLGWTEITALPPKGKRDLLRTPAFNVLEGDYPSVSPRPRARRNEQTSTAPAFFAPAAPASTAIDSASAELARPAPPFSLLELTILVPSAANDVAANDIAGDAEWRGHIVARIKKVDVSISERNLRYFHDRDRLEARKLAREYDADLKDFTWFQPKPAPGTAELWLAGNRAEVAEAPGPTIVPLELLERALGALSGN